MALQFPYEQPTGQICPEAHCVITQVSVPKQPFFEPSEDPEDEDTLLRRFVIDYSCLFYADVAAYEANKSPVGGWNGNYDFDEANSKNQYNIIKQVYLHMKSLPEFENATDC